jgi:iron complex transport system substrate-binding protein
MKKKTLVLVGIAVCAILLTSPVLASAGYSKIYGNANEDDTIDMRDTTYIKLVIFGKKPATTLADANYDGKISMLDVGQTKLIILDKEKQLTLVDHADRTVTIYKPVERVVTTSIPTMRCPVILDAADKVVGIDSGSAIAGKKGFLFCLQAHPELLDLPTIGSSNEPNVEAFLDLKPDVVFSPSLTVADSIQEQTGIPVVYLPYDPAFALEPSGFDSSTYETLRLAGKVLGKEDRAEWLISYVEDKLDRITKITNEIPEEEKPKVYPLVSSGIKNARIYGPVEWAGGINVAKEYLLSLGLRYAQINPEQVIIWNPDVIFLGCTGEHMAKFSETHPGLEVTKAVKEGKVYTVFGPYQSHNLIQMVAETYYMAKLLHPDKFQDLDVEKEANKMFKEVYGADDLYNKVQEARGLELYRWE